MTTVGTETDVTVGATSTTVIARPDEAEDILPAASVAFAVIVRPPADNADDVIDQLPPVAVALPSTVVPSVSLSVTVLPASAVPVNVGVVLLVILSEFDAPVSLTLVISGIDGALGDEVSSTYD